MRLVTFTPYRFSWAILSGLLVISWIDATLRLASMCAATS